MVSIALCSPKDIPFLPSVALSAIKASLGAVLTPLPNLSEILARSTRCQLVEIYKKNLPIIENEYPKIVNDFLFFALSEKYPEKTLRSEAVDSAIPSIRPIIAGVAPKEERYTAISGYIISEDISVNKLVIPRIIMFSMPILYKKNILISNSIFNRIM